MIDVYTVYSDKAMFRAEKNAEIYSTLSDFNMKMVIIG